MEGPTAVAPPIVRVALKPECVLKLDLELHEQGRSASFSRSLSSQVPQEFLCPISQRVMQDPVILCPSGQTYERRSIQQWLLHRNFKATCPMAGVKVTTAKLVVNVALQELIQQWLVKRPVMSGYSSVLMASACLPPRTCIAVTRDPETGATNNLSALNDQYLTYLHKGIWYMGSVHEDGGEVAIRYEAGGGPCGTMRDSSVTLSDFCGMHVTLTTPAGTFNAEWMSVEVVPAAARAIGRVATGGLSHVDSLVLAMASRAEANLFGSVPAPLWRTVQLQVTAGGVVMNPEALFAADLKLLIGDVVCRASIWKHSLLRGVGLWCLYGQALLHNLQRAGERNPRAMECDFASSSVWVEFSSDWTSAKILNPAGLDHHTAQVVWSGTRIEVEQTEAPAPADPEPPELELTLRADGSPLSYQQLLGHTLVVGASRDIWEITHVREARSEFIKGPPTILWTLRSQECNAQMEGVFNPDFTCVRKPGATCSWPVHWHSCTLKVVREAPQEPQVVLQLAEDGITIANPQDLVGHHFEAYIIVPGSNMQVGVKGIVTGPAPMGDWFVQLTTGPAVARCNEDGTAWIVPETEGSPPTRVTWLTCSVTWPAMPPKPSKQQVVVRAARPGSAVVNPEVLLGQPIIVDDTVERYSKIGYSTIQAYQPHNLRYCWLVACPLSNWARWGDFDQEFKNFQTICESYSISWPALQPEWDFTEVPKPTATPAEDMVHGEVPEVPGDDAALQQGEQAETTAVEPVLLQDETAAVTDAIVTE